MRPETPEPLFPAFLKLAGRRALLVGGGPVALGKARSLCDAGAVVTVVAPEVVPELRALVDDVRLRAFAPSDLEGVWFVVAAAPGEVNREVQAAAEVRCLFVNAVDDSAAATAYAAAVIRRGPVTVAFSTGGSAPALAGLIREGLESLLPEELERWSDVAREARAAWKAQSLPMSARRPRLLEALNHLYEERRS